MSDQTRRDQVFISYSHKDKKPFDQLQTSLKPLIRDKKISVWDDTKIKAGDKWREEIERAIASAKVAVLLVSPDFLASDFIAENELPPLIEAAEKEGLIILWVPVRPSLYKETVIKNYQATINPEKPLSAQRKHERERGLVLICETIKNAVTSQPESPVPQAELNVQLEATPTETPERLIKLPAAAVSNSALVVKVIDNSTVALDCSALQGVEVGQKFLIFRLKEARTEQIKDAEIGVEDSSQLAILLAAGQIIRLEEGVAILQALDIRSISNNGMKLAGLGAVIGTLIVPGIGAPIGVTVGVIVNLVKRLRSHKASFSTVEVGDFANQVEVGVRSEQIVNSRIKVVEERVEAIPKPVDN